MIVAIPGPSVMLIVKSTMLRGRWAAMLVAAGVFCGDLVWAAAAVGGITALIVASRPAFEILRLAGAGYPTGEVALLGSLFAALGFLSLSVYVAVLSAARRAVSRRLSSLPVWASGVFLVARVRAFVRSRTATSRRGLPVVRPA